MPRSKMSYVTCYYEDRHRTEVTHLEVFRLSVGALGHPCKVDIEESGAGQTP